MKRYKLINNCYDHYIINNIYDENYKDLDSPYSVKELVVKFPKDWELIDDDFVLPEKWYIVVTNENLPIISKWLGDHTFNLGDWSCVHYDKNACDIKNVSKEYSKITFEQFKTHVLNMKEEKEIIGYLPKQEHTDLAKKAVILAYGAKWLEEGGMPNIKKNGYMFCPATNKESLCFKLKEAGVLDLWFEPVYKKEEFKVGDWVILQPVKISSSFYEYADHYSKDLPIYALKVIQLSDNNLNKGNNFLVFNESKYNHPIDIFRKATEEEIKAAQTPQITINGYTGEFFDWGVKFGCAEITKEDFDELYTCIENFGEGQRTNKLIQSVTIGKGTFSKEQIKEIATYYLNKEK